jgi:ribosome-binding factor A
MNDSLKQKKIASLIKECLSTLLLTSFQDMDTGLVTITQVEISKDLKTAHIFVSMYGTSDAQQVLDRLNSQQKSLRKAVASRTKLKYNPKLIFTLDPTLEYEKRIDELLDDIRQDEH